jgi:hypothetical protein
MTRTGPQKIPGASQTYFYGTGTFSGSDMEVNCGVVHTTEGRTLPTYADSQGRRGAMAPTVTGVPDIAAKRIRWHQHYDVDESARALANKLGGVQTNTANAFQIELVGTCDDSKKTSWDGKKAGVDYLHWPTAPDWALAEVAWLVRWLNANHGVSLSCVKDWLAYGQDTRRPGITPASYGASPARMSFAEWQAFKGWCGHQHVPENDHGDPGNMNFARVIQLAKDSEAPATPTAPAQPAAKPRVSVAHVAAAARKDPPAAQGHTTYKAEVLILEKALKAEGLLPAEYVDGSFGSKTIAAYARWQRSPAGGGYTGAAADGIPGKASLKLLGARRGFTVTD